VQDARQVEDGEEGGTGVKRDVMIQKEVKCGSVYGETKQSETRDHSIP